MRFKDDTAAMKGRLAKPEARRSGDERGAEVVAAFGL
jgi:hypothetical protein